MWPSSRSSSPPLSNSPGDGVQHLQNELLLYKIILSKQTHDKEELWCASNRKEHSLGMAGPLKQTHDSAAMGCVVRDVVQSLKTVEMFTPGTDVWRNGHFYFAK
jgi:hypothetical protein